MVWFAATYQETLPENWLPFDDEAEAEAWQAEHATGVIWQVDLSEVDGAPA